MKAASFKRRLDRLDKGTGPYPTFTYTAPASMPNDDAVKALGGDPARSMLHFRVGNSTAPRIVDRGMAEAGAVREALGNLPGQEWRIPTDDQPSNPPALRAVGKR